ncbi:hypothetical protein FC831_13950 [Clostridium botulinum]|nr:hypothetical protein [Clostridium botulinum]
MNEKIIKCVVKLAKVFFPKNKSHIKSGEFGIFVADIIESINNCEELHKTIKLKGNCCEINYGESYNVSCKLADKNEKFGDTYEIIYINRLIDLKDKVKQHNFLTSILNETTVNALFEKYDDVISLLENEDVKSLTSIKGVGNISAMKMIDKYKDCKDYGEIYSELGMLGLTTNMIKRLVEFYKSPDVVIETVKNNPYKLVNVDGIGFKKADEIAEKIGIKGSNPNRVKGAIIYILSDNGANGKSYIHYSKLLSELNDTIGYVEQDIINNVAKELIDSKEVYVSDNEEMVGIYKYRKLEENISNELIRILNAESKINIKDKDVIIRDTEAYQGFNFNEEQLSFSEYFTKYNIVALTGGAGTGKSTALRSVVNLSKDYSCVGCSLSGKASLRLQECTDVESMTIHRLLGYQNGEFMFNKSQQMPYDVYIMDEATMTNGELFLSFLEAIPNGSKLILTGDVQQLTPIGSCQVFADVLNSSVIPTVKLIKINRQASKSEIINVAHKIINQEDICDSTFEGERTLGELKDLTIHAFKDNLEPQELVLKHFFERLKIEDDVMEVQVIVPMKNRGNMCTYNLNLKIQNKLNPVNPNKKNVIISMGKDKQYVLQIGDKVINTKNNYKVQMANSEEITGVFNGSMGIIKDIKDGYVMIDFLGIGEVIFDGKASKSLELAYACTVHKCQGSQFKSVIYAIDSSDYVLLNVENGYTGITRASNHCTFIFKIQALIKMLHTKELKNKQTYLNKLLK